MSQARRRLVAAGAAVVTGLSGLALVPATASGASGGPSADAGRGPSVPAGGRYNVKTATSKGFGGAVTSVDPEASRVGLEVLRRGGNAVDAAVATAAALGVTEPYSSGVGGGGYFVHYDGRTGKVDTLDGRETAPATMPRNAFDDPSTGQPYNFTPELVTSGVSVGTPGTLATWDQALRRWGTTSLARSLRPATQLASRGFTVDQTFHDQTADNQRRFANFPATSRLFLPGGQPPAVGSVLRNPDLAATYRLIARKGPSAFYTGPLAGEIARTAQRPPKRRDADLPVPAGYLTTRDLARYRVSHQAPTRVGYRGYDVYGMAPSSSGGSTVGEALNILERFGIAGMDDAKALHHYFEASALAFADRGAYVGDPAYVDVPLRDLLSDRFAAERACLIDPAKAATKPVAAGSVTSYDGKCDAQGDAGDDRAGHREHQHHQHDRGRPVGQHRGVHPDDRADRRLGHHRAGPGLPAEQRADRLQLRPHGQARRPEPDRGRQAPALLDVAHDRAQERQAVPGPRARPAARPSSPPCCRCCSTAWTAG